VADAARLLQRGLHGPEPRGAVHEPALVDHRGPGDIDTYRNPFLNEGPYVKRTYFGGNPDLEAQESEGTTYGFVLDVPGVEGLSLTADYWKIAAPTCSASAALAQIDESDTALLQAYTRAQIAAGVPVNQIDAGSGGRTTRATRRRALPADAGGSRRVRHLQRGEPGQSRGAGRPDLLAQPAVPEPVVERALRASTSASGTCCRASWGRLVVNSDWSYLARSTVGAGTGERRPVENDGCTRTAPRSGAARPR
jgi:hypothetical protein